MQQLAAPTHSKTAFQKALEQDSIKEIAEPVVKLGLRPNDGRACWLGSGLGPSKKKEKRNIILGTYTLIISVF